MPRLLSLLLNHFLGAFWKRLRWQDDQLVWNPAEWGGITSLVMDTADVSVGHGIWVPDIIFFNVAAPEEGASHRAWVSFTGEVSRSYQTLSTVIFRPNLALFPYDTQSVKWELGSWSFNEAKVKLADYNSNKFKVRSELPPEWTVVSTTEMIRSVKHNCCVTPYMQKDFVLNIRRNPDFYESTIVQPAILVNTISYFSFYMNRDVAPARTVVCMTSLLAMITLGIIVARTLPVLKEKTWLEKVASVNLGFSFVALAVWVWIQYLQRGRGGWVSRFLLWGKTRQEQSSGGNTREAPVVELSEVGALPHPPPQSSPPSPPKGPKPINSGYRTEEMQGADALEPMWEDEARRLLVGWIDWVFRVLYPLAALIAALIFKGQL